jgi:hypothetical protein
MAEREPFYAQARHCIDCASKSDEDIVNLILEIVKDNE